jgi:hypothetical protein
MQAISDGSGNVIIQQLASALEAAAGVAAQGSSGGGGSSSSSVFEQQLLQMSLDDLLALLEAFQMGGAGSCSDANMDSTRQLSSNALSFLLRAVLLPKLQQLTGPPPKVLQHCLLLLGEERPARAMQPSLTGACAAVTPATSTVNVSNLL